MIGKTKSRRHDLFLDKKEWERSSYHGINYRLGQLMNPHLNYAQQKNAIELGKAVFFKFFIQADPQLKKVANDLENFMPMKYSLFVLVPETYIHKFEVIDPLSVFNFLEQQDDKIRQFSFFYVS